MARYIDMPQQDYTGWSLDQLVKERQKKAQAANRQMRRLNAQGYDKGNAMSKYAKPYLHRQGRETFSERKSPLPVTNPYKETKAGYRKKTPAEMEAEQIKKEKAELAQLDKFLRSKTSTIKGIKEQRAKARDTFRERYGVDFDDETIDMMFEVDAFEWIRKTYGSDTLNEVVKAINEGQSTPAEVIKKVTDIRVRYKAMSDADKAKPENDIINWGVEKFFEEIGLKWKPEYRQTRR